MPLVKEEEVTVWATVSLFSKTTVLPCWTVSDGGTNFKLLIDTVKPFSGLLEGDAEAEADGGTKSVGKPIGKPDELVGTVELKLPVSVNV